MKSSCLSVVGGQLREHEKKCEQPLGVMTRFQLFGSKETWISALQSQGTEFGHLNVGLVRS